MSDPIYVTRPLLPDLEDYVEYLRRIWSSQQITNNGSLVRELEALLAQRLGVAHVICVSSGTAALELAIRALDLEGEIITTPFTFVATGNIIAWQRCRPVFIDIRRDTWNLDPDLIEPAITQKTSAVLPVHTFSVPCEVERIEEIAARRGLRVIYDATHAMSVTTGGRSVFERGDISCLSLHATKLFSTGEGGACITRDPKLAERLRRLRYFGLNESLEAVDVGTNAKMSELHAALGLASLSRLGEALQLRRERHDLYRELLAGRVTLQKLDVDRYNYSYFPVLFSSERLLLSAQRALEQANVFPRRYFHPALNTLPIFPGSPALPVAEDISPRVLCLPLYAHLSLADVRRIAAVVGNAVS
jgi:dTDP-4-amino-4,6-dideoxygalactose transaminase